MITAMSFHCRTLRVRVLTGWLASQAPGILVIPQDSFPSAESWVVTGDQMTPPVAIYHNREKWVLSSRDKLYQLRESWSLRWLDKDGVSPFPPSPLLTAFCSRGSEPCSGWIDVLAFRCTGLAFGIEG